ncbi:hypothetical protein [Nonomuraea typhae]|uniref:Uncharacterized protein n=1 Tax=Nonomuraea typhae TaxID=2603600 RepID=A0ABW7YM38_9ACTN
MSNFVPDDLGGGQRGYRIDDYFLATYDLELRPVGYTGPRNYCMQCDAFLDEYIDGYGPHLRDTQRQRNCRRGGGLHNPVRGEM